MVLSPLLYLEQLSVVLWDILKSGLYHKYPVYFQVSFIILNFSSIYVLNRLCASQSCT